jgi:ATP-dependent DNA ligase
LPEGSEAVLFAFDLIELVGKDLRSAPLEQRKSQLAKLLATVERAHFPPRLQTRF